MEFLGSEKTETYVADNLINTIVCDDDNFTGDVYIEGHRFINDGADLEFVVQTIPATGQTPASLTTALGRMTRMANASGQTIATSKKVYGYQSTAGQTDGVPGDATKVHCIMSAAENRSLKAATAISYNDYYVLFDIYGRVNKKTQGGGIIRAKTRTLGNSFQTIFKEGTNTLGQGAQRNSPGGMYIDIIRPNSDILITGADMDATVAVAGGFHGVLLSVVG